MIIEGKKRLWQEYQKEIADDNFFYVRSCVRQNFFPGAEEMFLNIMRDSWEKMYMKIPDILPAQESVIIPMLFPSKPP